MPNLAVRHPIMPSANEPGEHLVTSSKSIFVIGAEQTARLLPMDGLIANLRAFFIAGCEAPPRHHHTIHVPGEPDATLLLMPSWQPKSDSGGYLGTKLVTVFPGNSRHGMPALTSVYLLFDSGTGVQLAAIDGNTITLRRTVATSALAASFLAHRDAECLLVLGSGRVARLLPEAYRAVRSIKKINIWNINPDSALRMARSLTDSGIEATVVSDLEQGVRSADIVSAATLATAPLIRGEWLRPGTHVDLIGAFTPKMREADAESVQRSAVFVDTIDALHEAGDLVDPIREGVFSSDLLKGTLADLCNGNACGRTSREEITLFKAVGSALADLAAASMVYKAIEGSSEPNSR